MASGAACVALAVGAGSLLLRRAFGLRFIGLTGGISSGKSSVSSYLQSPRHGVALLDFDLIAREVVTPGHPSGALQSIRQRFGDGVLQADGSLDRAKLGAIIFGDAQARAKLNKAMQWPIWRTFLLHAGRLFFCEGRREVVLDVPLLFESKISAICSENVVVYTSPDVQKERLMKRDGVTSEVADSKIGAQWPLDKKRALADVVIDNDGTLPQLHEKLDAWMAAHAERQTRHWWQQWVPTVPTLLLVAVATPVLLSLTAFSRWITG